MTIYSVRPSDSNQNLNRDIKIHSAAIIIYVSDLRLKISYLSNTELLKFRILPRRCVIAISTFQLRPEFLNNVLFVLLEKSLNKLRPFHLNMLVTNIKKRIKILYTDKFVIRCTESLVIGVIRNHINSLAIFEFLTQRNKRKGITKFILFFGCTERTLLLEKHFQNFIWINFFHVQYLCTRS